MIPFLSAHTNEKSSSTEVIVVSVTILIVAGGHLRRKPLRGLLWPPTQRRNTGLAATPPLLNEDEHEDSSWNLGKGTIQNFDLFTNN